MLNLANEVVKIMEFYVIWSVPFTVTQASFTKKKRKKKYNYESPHIMFVKMITKKIIFIVISFAGGSYYGNMLSVSNNGLTGILPLADSNVSKISVSCVSLTDQIEICQSFWPSLRHGNVMVVGCDWWMLI